VEGPLEYPWRATSKRGSLLGNVFSHGLLGFHTICLSPFHTEWMVHDPEGLCTGLSSSRHWGDTIYGNTQWLHLQRVWSWGTGAWNAQESVWLEAGQPDMVQVTLLLTTVHGLMQSIADNCIFYWDGIVLLIYVDDTICVFRDKGAGQKLAKELQQSFDITMEGTIEDFLGVKFEKRSNRSFSLSQPQLIDLILKDLELIDGWLKRAKPKRTPAKTSLILWRDTNSLKHLGSWDYWSVIGKLNFLEKSTRLDISYQCINAHTSPSIQEWLIWKLFCI